jgi:hypothetical protein
MDKIKEIFNVSNNNIVVSNSSPLHMILWNINTLNDRKLNKLNEILLMFEGNNLNGANKTRNNSILIDVIVIIEMGKKQSKFNSFHLYDFKLYSQLRHDRKGGGIGIFIRKTMSARIIYSQLTTDYEFLQIEAIKDNNTPHNIIAAYRPPSGNQKEFLSALESVLMLNDNNALIVGDININVNETSSSEEYTDMLQNFNYKVANEAITRYNKLTLKHSRIDHVLIDRNRADILALTTSNIVTQDYSDHNIICIKQYGSIDRKLPTSQLFTKINKQKTIRICKTKISNLPLNIFPDTQCRTLTESIREAIEECKEEVKVHIPRSTSIPPWADNRYVNMCNRVHNISEKIQKLKAQRKPITRLQESMRLIGDERDKYALSRMKLYNNDKVMLNVKESWKTIKQLAGLSTIKDQIVLEINSIRTSDDQVICDTFQDYFMSIVGSSNSSVGPSTQILGNYVEKSFSFSPVDIFEVEMKIKQLKIGKATGLDGISPFLLSSLSTELSKHVTIMVNQMLIKSIYPKELKITRVMPNFKEGSTQDVKNYRPISITTALDKVVEKIIQEQLNDYLQQEKILDMYQFGFKRNRGCEDLIAKVVSTASSIVDNKNTAILISLDISKAFDSVDHEILLRKLNHYGIRGASNELIRNFLHDRIQHVKINSCISKPGIIQRGIPQGTLLGPLLFSLYINDLKDLPTHSKLYKFADDLLMIFEIPCKCDDLKAEIQKIEHDISLITNYYYINKLTLNIKKSQAIIIGTENKDEISSALESLDVAVKIEMKYLGIIIDENLKFEQHYYSLTKKLNQTIGAVSSLRHKLMTRPLMNFYFAHFQSHLIYSMFLFARLPSKDIQHLQILQNRVLKMIHKLPPTFDTHRIYLEHAKNVLPVMGLLFQSITGMMKKSIIEQDEALIQTELLKSERTKNILIKAGRSRTRREDIEIIGASIYNCLPIGIKNENFLKSFKNKTKKYLLTKSASLVSTQQIFTKDKII